jgi:hypothetical protein
MGWNRLKPIFRSLTYILYKYLILKIFNKFVDNKSFKPSNNVFIEKNGGIESINTYWLSIRKHQIYDSLFATIFGNWIKNYD